MNSQYIYRYYSLYLHSFIIIHLGNIIINNINHSKHIIKILNNY
jgi:hypothetical protein